jgi:hypothetical protein
MILNKKNIRDYLSQVYGLKINVNKKTSVNSEFIKDLKGFGYGVSYLIAYY